MGLLWDFVGMLRSRVHSNGDNERCRGTVQIEVRPVPEPNRKSVIIMRSFGLECSGCLPYMD